jgi:hypothetical protein
MINVVDDFQAKWLMVNHRITFLGVPASVIRHFNKWLVRYNDQLRTALGTEQAFQKIVQAASAKMANKTCMSKCRMSFEV